MSLYLVKFTPTHPEDAPFFAGMHKGAAGFAPAPESALVFTTEQDAERFLHFAYSDAIASLGRVVEFAERP